jgi:hypothetical protein
MSLCYHRQGVRAFSNLGIYAAYTQLAKLLRSRQAPGTAMWGNKVYFWGRSGECLVVSGEKGTLCFLPNPKAQRFRCDREAVDLRHLYVRKGEAGSCKRGGPLWWGGRAPRRRPVVGVSLSVERSPRPNFLQTEENHRRESLHTSAVGKLRRVGGARVEPTLGAVEWTSG